MRRAGGRWHDANRPPGLVSVRRLTRGLRGKNKPTGAENMPMESPSVNHGHGRLSAWVGLSDRATGTPQRQQATALSETSLAHPKDATSSTIHLKKPLTGQRLSSFRPGYADQGFAADEGRVQWRLYPGSGRRPPGNALSRLPAMGARWRRLPAHAGWPGRRRSLPGARGSPRARPAR